jgi:putative SOS response-associated peptidase YedK
VPYWAKDPAIGNRMINARADSLGDKPAFESAFRKRRCLVVVSGFYEWQRVGKHAQPYLLRMSDGSPFGLAGLWEVWRNPAGEKLETCAVVTTGRERGDEGDPRSHARHRPARRALRRGWIRQWWTPPSWSPCCAR